MEVCKRCGIQNELSLIEMLESNAGSGSGFCLADRKKEREELVSLGLKRYPSLVPGNGECPKPVLPGNYFGGPRGMFFRRWELGCGGMSAKQSDIKQRSV